MEQFWAGGHTEHQENIKKDWMREKHRLLFKYSLAENDDQRQSIQDQIDEVEEKIRSKLKHSDYSNYLTR